jgi:hypothetical protein
LCTVPLKVIHIIPRYFGKRSKFSVELYFWRRSCRFIGETFLRILYRCIASKNRILNRLYRFIARKICLYRQEYRFIAQNLTNFIASSVQENFCLVFSIASSVTKILANKIVSLYSIFFSKIVYLYRFKRYIFEYRCPTLHRTNMRLTLKNLDSVTNCFPYHTSITHTFFVLYFWGWQRESLFPSAECS